MNTTNQNQNNNNLPAIIAGIVAVLLVLGGIGYYTMSQKSMNKVDMKDTTKIEEKKMEDKKMEDTKIDEKKMNDSSTTTKKGEYKNYSKESSTNDFAHAKDGHHVVLFFNATWCPTCQSTVKDINANIANIDPKLHLLSVDYDTNQDLRAKYGVTMQHTFVEVDMSGNLIKKTTGLNTLNQINNYANGS
jgi:thiol-disulfide isomerase/thioredoxin